MLTFLLFACSSGDSEVPKESTPVVETDTDGDGLDDALEAELGTDPATADTDGDGLSDGDELITHHTNPLSSDSDGDLISDGDEVAQGTSVSNPDTDGDGFSDGEEVELGSDPLVADRDRDGLSDEEEAALGSDPEQVDSDGDGLEDGVEVGLGTSPVAVDSDGDGLSDAVEVADGLDPLDAASPALYEGISGNLTFYSVGQTRTAESASDYDCWLEFSLSGSSVYTPQSECPTCLFTFDVKTVVDETLSTDVDNCRDVYLFLQPQYAVDGVDTFRWALWDDYLGPDTDAWGLYAAGYGWLYWGQASFDGDIPNLGAGTFSFSFYDVNGPKNSWTEYGTASVY